MSQRLRIGQGGRVRDALEMTVDFVLLHGDGFEEENLAVHIDFEPGDCSVS